MEVWKHFTDRFQMKFQITTWHYDVIPGKAQGGDTWTFSMLFRMVKGLYPAIFSFLLIFFRPLPKNVLILLD